MRIFISYHTPDLEKARAAEAAIARARPGAECFLAPRNLAGGAYWIPRIFDELARADAVLFLAGARIGPWQELEYYEALRLSRDAGGRPHIVPVVIAGQAPGLPAFNLLHLIFAPDPAAPETAEAIGRALDSRDARDETPAWQRFQPYKGLPSLQEADAAFFFGRADETAAVLDLAARQPDRIVALLGQSGVGKSSLARAGVLAALRSQAWPRAGESWPAALKDSRAFLPLVVRPGEAPLKELALAFAQLYRTESYEIDREARGWAQNFADGAGLRDLLRVTRDSIASALDTEPPRRFVLYVDQGEELYASGNADTARRFSGLLAEAAAHEAFSVMLSLRSDYYAAYQDDGDLFHASERVDILPLSREVLSEVVRRPAVSLGARFESDDMVERVAEATAREPGALPLLSDLMHDMWLRMQARDDGVLRWADNPEIIDVGAPLRKRADEFIALPGSDAAEVRRLFTLHLAHVPETGAPVRRRARRSECSETEWRLAETLANQDWRLLSLTAAGDGEPVAEVAHERLLRSWPLLDGWLADERDFLVWRGQVERDAEAADADLLSGRRLAVARGWFERREGDLAPHLRKFIAASIAADDHRIAAERRRRRTIFGTVAAGLVGALILAGLAGWQWRVAERERAKAEDAAAAAQAAKVEADRQRATAQRSLALATDTANGLIFNVVEKFRDFGIPAPVIKDILDQVLKLQDELAQGGQTSPQMLSSQAAALEESAATLLALGDTAGSLKAALKERDIMRSLIAKAPNDPDYKRELSVAEERIGDALTAQGNVKAALVSYRAELAAIEPLAKADPGNTEWPHFISVVEVKIGDALSAEGNLYGALAEYRKGVEILTELTKKSPTNWEWQRNLSVADNKTGDALMQLGNAADALTSYRASLKVMETLTQRDPSNTEWQMDLAISNGDVGAALVEQGNFADAVAALRRASAIFGELVKRDPSNTDWQRDLAVSDERAGDAMMAQNDYTGAIGQYRAELDIMAPLAKKDPSNADWQRFISVVYQKIGDALNAQGNTNAALEAWRDAKSIFAALIRKYPSNSEWRRDLSVVEYKMADALITQHDLPAALAECQSSLALTKALVDEDPGNARWQHGLSMGEAQLGDVLEAEGKTADAVAAYRDSLAIRRKLALASPDNAQLQTDLVVILFKLAQAGADPVANYTEALAILQRLDAVGKLTPKQKGWIAAIKASLEKTKAAPAPP